ncbi:CHASE2 domain-containing protein [Spirochaeta cellobiosiphila]|uniref:CHASE2 domain-containing protein n=1 Tax=Spirochaeta cellobiosiphila TaxID=504483 RepID=UPI0004025719|nr:adenylate/guanylate cyclase domain-containing protein [Spirochaeta cellobiosiphila]
MKKSKTLRFLKTENFSFIIALFIFLISNLLLHYTTIPKELEKHYHDFCFQVRNIIKSTSEQEGSVKRNLNNNINSDIQIIALDSNTLNRVGTWPFPRYQYGNFLTNLSRIRDVTHRENSVFLDVFFIDKGTPARNDGLFAAGIKENGKVFSEIDINYLPLNIDDSKLMKSRMDVLFDNYGEIEDIKNVSNSFETFYGVTVPLLPFVKNSYAYGHASFVSDSDDLYRKQRIVARIAFLNDEFELSKIDVNINLKKNEYLAYYDFDNRVIPISNSELNNLNLLKQQIMERSQYKLIDTDNDGEPDGKEFYIRRFEEHYIPSITLSLALNYFNKKLSDVHVTLGEVVSINNPQMWDKESNSWVPYRILRESPIIDEDGNTLKAAVYEDISIIEIPIDKKGDMTINYMGPASSEFSTGHQTYNIRSLAGYISSIRGVDSSRWPRTMALDNKIIMMGAFTKGIAEDEKYTPYGPMYGVELHANALNTILMNNFLRPIPFWINEIILALTILIISIISSRISTILAFFISILYAFILFIATTIFFETQNLLINFTVPVIAIISSFTMVTIYRVMTEEKDKKRIQAMFGQYVSPKVVKELVNTKMPELGGVDRELTVLFSDIRGFTTLSESLSPQELVNHLNKYLASMTDLILEYEGTLDKYVGDEIMCFWGAPIPQKNHAELACKCALRMMAVLKELNESWPEDKRIDIGIGLNSGIMTVGNMGSQGRMNYTLMGDNVNLGARLEGTNKQYLTNVIISEYTYSLIKDTAIVRELDNIRVKGKNKPVLIYELIDFVDGLDVPKKIKN